MNNMSKAQIDRWLDIQSEKNQQIKDVASALYEISSAITGSYNGNTKSAFWGMSEAMFMMVNADREDEGLHIKIQK